MGVQCDYKGLYMQCAKLEWAQWIVSWEDGMHLKWIAMAHAWKNYQEKFM